MIFQDDAVVLLGLILQLRRTHLITAAQDGDLPKLPLVTVLGLLHLEANEVAGGDAVDVFAQTRIRLGEHVEPRLTVGDPEGHPCLDGAEVTDMDVAARAIK